MMKRKLFQREHGLMMKMRLFHIKGASTDDEDEVVPEKEFQSDDNRCKEEVVPDKGSLDR